MNTVYNPIKEIGYGSFSVVCKARDRKQNKPVAIKRLIQNEVPNSQWTEILAEFHHQANATTRLIHRNIVKTFERGEDDKGPFVVMELVDGPNLTDYLKLKGGRLSTAEAVSIALGVANALLYAQKSGVAHSRIKPSNVLIRRNGQHDDGSQQIIPLVTDFGLGTERYGTGPSAKQQRIKNRFYLAPESIQNAESADITSDIYALGKMLYELVTGDKPDVLDPDKIPNMSGLADVIFNCTKSNPLQRYSDPEVLIQSLKRIGQQYSKSIPQAKTGEKPCPVCKTPNKKSAKYCITCSSGLIQLCPECGNEEPVDQNVCHACGTDIAVLMKYSDGLASMKRLAGEQKWQDIVHLSASLPRTSGIQKEKGLAIQKEILDLRDLTLSRLAERDRLDRAARTSLANGQLELAIAHAIEALRLDPHDRKPRDGEASLKALASRSQTLVTMLKSAKFDHAAQFLQGMSATEFPECARNAIAKQIDEDKSVYSEKLNTAAALIQNKQISVANEMLAEMQEKWPYSVELFVQADRARRLYDNFEMRIRQARKNITSKLWEEAFKAAHAALSIEPSDPRVSALLSQSAEGYYKRLRKRKLAGFGLLLAVISAWTALRLVAIVGNKRIYNQAIILAENANYTNAIAIHNESRNIKWLAVSSRPLPTEIEDKAILQSKLAFAALIAEARKAKEVNDWFSCFNFAGEALALNIERRPGTQTENWASYQNIADDTLRNEPMIKEATELKAEAQKNLTRSHPDMAIELALVEAGSFTMGTTEGDEDESPEREVRITSHFWISKHEITNKDYDFFISETKYDGRPEADKNYLRHKSGAITLASPDAEYPAVYVSWKNAVQFCLWLTEHERKSGRLPDTLVYRLPTEAEWEFAARGGILSRQTKFSGSNAINDVAWHIGNSNAGNSRVGLKKPNELGVFDMSGNVWEWCHDWYGNYATLASVNPVGPGNGPGRVCRGGSCLYLAENSRVANRYLHPPHFTDSSLGFRIVIAHPIP